MEQQQTADDLVGSGKQGPAKGKGKQKKPLIFETKPSPNGRRIMPSIEALRVKVEAAKRRKPRGDKVNGLLAGFNSRHNRPLCDAVGCSVVHWICNPTTPGFSLLSGLCVMTLDSHLGFRFADLSFVISAINQ